jgi:uncharacterized repeat protein (TIGR01451 family)
MKTNIQFSQMKSYQSFLIILFLLVIGAKTQAQDYRQIPDSNFRYVLANVIGLDTIMYNDSIDISSPAILNVLNIPCDNKGIHSLEGVQYFTNLDILNCPNNLLTSLPTLPAAMRFLYCDHNQIAALPSLPTTLSYLTADYNLLTSLPSLPSSLNHLSCNFNQLTSLPLLNNDLHVLYVNHNQLTALPTLPIFLSRIECANNFITVFPTVPSGVSSIVCNDNLLTSFPEVPSALNSLLCYNNPINCVDFVINWQPSSPATFYFFNTNVVCVPRLNYTFILSSPTYELLPVCDDLNNPNGCLSGVHLISGKVFADINNNCIYDAGDYIMSNVQLKNVQEGNAAFSSSTGYQINTIFSDTAIITVNNLDSIFSITCSGFDTIPIYFGPGSSHDTTNIDFPIHPNLSCYNPMISSFTSSTPRVCNTIEYTIEYGNMGVAIATSPYIIIELDTANLDTIQSLAPFTITGNQLRFDVADLGPFEFRSLIYTAFIKCDAVLGTSSCNRATIYPLSNCSSYVGYDHSDIAIETRCDEDTIIIVLKNSGTSNMTSYGYVSIYEDEIIQKMDSFILNTGDSFKLRTIIGADKTWTAIVMQNRNHPSNPILIRHNDKCSLTTPVKTNVVVPHFSRFDEAIDYEENCVIVRGSYDPNHKSVLPEGMYDEHYTSPNQQLNYRIDFQNTGTDTAFRVVVVDTLSTDLDIATIIPGASSHPYQLKINANNTLLFIFDPIALPDSNVSVVNSQGYVTFKIKAKSSIAPKTVINNVADIYFDMNTPVRTNSVFNTMYDTVTISLAIGIQSTQNETTKVLVFPNPTTQYFIIDLNEVIQNMDIQLVDMNGKVIMNHHIINSSQLKIDATSLTKGMYIIQCIENGQLNATRKIIIQ